MGLTQYFYLGLIFLPLTVLATTQELDWTLSYKQVNPDNQTPRQIISINNQFPPPIIRLKRGDTLRLNLYNDLNEPTSLHFHGIFQKGSNQMDGPTMLTQCPIPPQSHFTYEFTVDQTGTYWYHAHESVQYGDGLRGALIIEDDEKVGYDDDVVITLTDWYYGNTEALLKQEHGDEPDIDSSLFNDTRETKWEVETDHKYLIRLINIGMSASQYFYIEDHNLTIVEIDGVKVEPVEVDSVMLTTGQRYGVILQTKNNREKNYGMMSATNMMMRKVYLPNWIVYDDSKPLEAPPEIKTRELHYIDDLELRPLEKIPRLREPDHQFEFVYKDMEYNGQHYWTMNGTPHLSPKIPTLMTLLSSDDTLYNEPVIYGNSTNVFFLQSGEVVEIVLNSNEMMKHPFHLHGHNFQVLARGRKMHYDHDSSKFPEFPMIRDTVTVPNHGYVVLRFVADNPGVWFFHCHTDWHAATGLGVVFIESPELIRKSMKLSDESLKICSKSGIKTRGNAAGNDKDFLNLEGDVSIYNIDQESVETTMSVSTPSASASAQSGSINVPKIPIEKKIKVLIVYGSVMLTIAVIGAVVVNNRIRSNIHNKKGRYTRLSTIANNEPGQGEEL